MSATLDPPPHYRAGDRDLLAYLFEVDHMDAAAFCRGNIMKYAQRAGKKGGQVDLVRDLEKIIDYAQRWKAEAERCLSDQSA